MALFAVAWENVVFIMGEFLEVPVVSPLRHGNRIETSLEEHRGAGELGQATDCSQHH